MLSLFPAQLLKRYGYFSKLVVEIALRHRQRNLVGRHAKRAWLEPWTLNSSHCKFDGTGAGKYFGTPKTQNNFKLPSGDVYGESCLKAKCVDNLFNTNITQRDLCMHASFTPNQTDTIVLKLYNDLWQKNLIRCEN